MTVAARGDHDVMMAVAVAAAPHPDRRHHPRVERALHRPHLGAEAAGHIGDHVVLADVHDAGGDLGREVAVAEVPGDAGERPLVAAGDLQQPLGRRLDGDDAAVLQPGPSPGASTGALARSAEAPAARPGQGDAPPGAVVVVRCATSAGRLHFQRPARRISVALSMAAPSLVQLRRLDLTDKSMVKASRSSAVQFRSVLPAASWTWCGDPGSRAMRSG